MSLRKPLQLCLLAVLCLAIPAYCQLGSTSGSGLNINDADRVTLAGNVPSQLLSATDEGLASADLPMNRMIMVLSPRAGKQAERDQLIRDLHDPASPLYHQWLTPEQYAQRFSISDADLNSVIAWLQSYGFSVDEVARGRGWINFSGTVTQVETAFQTQIRQYRMNGVLHHANAAPISIPRGLSSAVIGLVSLHDFQKTPQHLQPHAIDPNLNSGSEHFIAPADFATIYNVNPLYTAGTDGTGQNIAIVGRTDIKMSDVTTFRSYFALPAKNPVFINNGADPGDLGGGEETEADLDVEWSGAVGRNATVNFVISKSTLTTDGVDLSAQYIVDNKVAPVMSTSFGECESQLGSTENAFYNNLWAQAVTEGITAFVSTGDSGAAGCDLAQASQGTGRAVSGLSTTPYNVAVGGTQFMDTANPSQYWSATQDPVTKQSVLSYIPEQAWNESGSVAGGEELLSTGGGVSTIYAKPSWQVGPGVPADGKRDVPDVSLSAATHDGYVIVQGGGTYAVGGTSASSPSFAGLLSLVNQATGASQGNANTVFYALGNNQYNGCAPTIFHDTTIGNNTVPNVTGFNATTAYDLVTGLGSVNATALVQNWNANATFLVCASPSTVSSLAGGTGTATITTSASGAFNAAISLSASGLPTGVTASFSPNSIAAPGTGSSLLTLTVGANVAPGSYQFTVSGTGGSVTQNTTVTLLVTAAPDFSISALPTAVNVVQGSSNTSTVTTVAISGFSSAIALSATGMPTGLTVAFNPTPIPAPGGGSSIATFTASSATATGTYPIAITGTAGALTHNATVNVTVTPAPDFTISASPNASASAGGSGNSTVTTAALNAFDSAVTLSSSGAPTGVTVSFNPDPIVAPGSGSSTATFTVASTVAAGMYPITITGTGGGLTHNATVNLTVTAVVSSGWQAAFDFRATSTYVTDPANTTYVNADRYPTTRGGFTFGWASTTGLLTRDRSKTDDPRLAGIGAAPNNAAPLTFEIDVPTPGTYTVALAMGDAVSAQYDGKIAFLDGSTPLFSVSATQIAANTFLDATGVVRTAAQWPTANVVKQVTLAGTKLMIVVGSNVGKAEYTPIAFIGVAQTGGGSPTPDFTISAAPAAVSAVQGGSNTSTVTTAAINGFNSAVTLTASGAPTGVTVGFDTNPIAAPGSGSSNATFTVSSSAVTGTYPISITGTGGGQTHSTTVNLTVTAAPDFTITAAPLAVSAAQGASNTSTVTTAALNGFSSAIALSATGMPTGVTVGFNPTSIIAPGNGSSTATFTVGSAVATGTYPVTITGNGGGIMHSTTVNLTVTLPPDFTISASPTAVSAAQGGSNTSSVSTTVLNGFNSAVTLSASGAPTGVTVGFNPSSIAAPGSGSSTATFTVGSSVATGTYPITVTGMGAGITHSTTVNLTVMATQQQGFNVGFDFRATQAYVADPANDTYVLGASTRYPTTRNSVTFGWTGTLPSTRDRSTTVDKRLAGINFVAGNVAPGVFQINLPGPGTYTISLAMGDAGSSQNNCKVEFKDGSTSLFTVSANALALGAFADANGTVWTSAQWPASNTTRQVTVTGSTLTMYIGANNSNSGATTVAFVGVSQ